MRCMWHPLTSKRAQGMPGEGLTHGPPAKRKAGGRYHRFSQIIRHSLRDGFNGFLRALPGARAFLPPSRTDRSARLTPASGCQDHTTSPSASAPFVRTTKSCAMPKRPSHPRRTFGDDRPSRPPSSRRDARVKAHISVKRKRNLAGKSRRPIGLELSR